MFYQKIVSLSFFLLAIALGQLALRVVNPVMAGEIPQTISQAKEASKDETLRNAIEQEDIQRINGWSHYELARHYWQRFDLNLAAVEMEEAICSQPSEKLFHRDFCLLSLLRLKFDRVLAEFMLVTGIGEPIPLSALEKGDLDHHALKLHYRKALSYAVRNRWSNAIAELKWAKSYYPDNLAVCKSLAFAYACAGQFALADQAYVEAFKIDPGDPYGRADYAFLLTQQGKDRDALDELSKAVQLKPDAPALHVDLAWLAERNGNLPQANQELSEAIKLSPNHASLWMHLGNILKHQGKLSEAHIAYQHALSLEPDNVIAKQELIGTGIEMEDKTLSAPNLNKLQL